MAEEKTIAKGSAWVLSSNILTKFISFIYTIIIARLLITEEIGIFYLVLSILGILYIFTDLGLLFSLKRYVPYLYGKQAWKKLKSLIKLGYLGGGILTLIFSVIMFFLSDYISVLVAQPAIAPILKLMSIWLLIKEIDDVNRGVLLGRKKMLEAQGIDIIQNAVKLVLTIIALYIVGFNAEALSIAYLVSFILVLPLGIYWVMRETKTWVKTEDETFSEHLSLGKEVVSFGLIVTLISVFGTVLQYTDKIMIGYLLEDSLNSIGIYSIALGLANLLLIFTGMELIFFPVVSELYGKKDMEAMNRTLKTSIKWMIMLLVPLALIMGVFGDNLLELFYGEVYSDGAIVLLLFVIGLFIRSIFYLPQLILSAMRRLDVELKAVGAAAVVNIVLNLIFIPLWGINGAAFASLSSFLVLSIMIFYYSKRIYNFSFPKVTHKPLVAAVIALVILLLFKGPIAMIIDEYIPSIQIGISEGQLADELIQKVAKLLIFGLLFFLSCGLYLMALLWLKVFEEEELSLLESALRKARLPENYISFVRKFLEGRWLKLRV